MKIALIGSHGIIGAQALREALATEYNAVIALVQEALQKKLATPERPQPWVSVYAIFPDRAVVHEAGRLYAYPYTLGDDNQVTLGERKEVVLDYKDVAMREALGAFIESNDAAGTKWRIRVIRAGLSGNKNYYPDSVLREAVPLFNGARVFEKADSEHLKSEGKAFRNLIGRLVEPVFVEGKGKDSGEIHATLELLASAGDTPAKIREAYDRGMAADLFGFSIDANGRVKLIEGKRVAQKITKVNSVDLIIEPGAGGQLISLIEAQNSEEDSDMKLRLRMLQFIEAKRPDVYKTINADSIDDDSLLAKFNEAQPAPAPTGVSKEELDKTVRMVEARADMRTAITESTLPQVAKDKLRKQFDGLESFTEAQVDEAIKTEREYLAKFTESGHVVLPEGEVAAGKDRAEKVRDMLDAFFDPKHKDHRKVQSFKECYVEITGDKRVTGELRNCDVTRLREAVADAVFRESVSSSTFANVLGDSITRRMIADYAQNTRYDVWRRLTGNPVPVTDFRTNERTRMGGYGDLPAVAQGQPYGALTTPSDEKATYAISKRGGTEDITLEAVRNDDVGLIRRIPAKLSLSAKRTLSKFVLDFIRTNPIIYDGTALFTVGHGNLSSAALAAPSLAAARLAVLQQTELSSADRIGIPPVNLWVPFDQEEAAFDLFRRQTNNDTDFVESLQMSVVPVWYWSDANDWAVTCDPNEVPTVEIAFLDGNEEPELFVQDSPTSGSMFTHDKVTYKIRHIYGGNVLEYRGMHKSVVA